MSTCAAKTATGKRCRATAQTGSDVCFFHDPAKAEERAAAQVEGGKQRQTKSQRMDEMARLVVGSKCLPEDTPDVELVERRDVVAIVRATINQVRTGKVSPKVGAVVGQLAAVALKAFDEDDQGKRLRELEEQFRPLKGLTPEQLMDVVRAGDEPAAAEEH